jgi:GNAT superfamily N-acetyltransferase
MVSTLQALGKVHDVKKFDCGVAELNQWLHTVAMQHQKNGMSKTFVAVDEINPSEILGFATMAIRTFTPATELPAALRKKLPQAVPGYTLARLAIATKAQGQGLGEFMLLDAMERACHAAQSVGGFALFVDAKDGAAEFYVKYGFVALPDDPSILVMPMAAMPAFPSRE